MTWKRNLSVNRAAVVGLAACIGLAACDDAPTAPGPDDQSAFDAQTAQTSLDAMDNVLQSAEWASYQAMSERVAGSGIVATVVPAFENVDGLSASSDAAAELLSAASRIPLISPGNLGNTFVIDPGTGEYVVDPDRAGAPSNGVRFVLYEVFEGTEDPDLSNEIGQVDLVDAGAGAAGIDLRLTAVANGLTFIDYGVAIEGSDTEGTVTIDGFATDGTDRLDFAFNVDATDNLGDTTIDLDASLSVDTHGLTVNLTADGTNLADQESIAIVLNVGYGSESLDIDVTGNDSDVDATFSLNGSVFATATGHPDNPLIRGADGMELSDHELAVLGEVIQTADEVFEFFEELVEPAEGIILLATIL